MKSLASKAAQKFGDLRAQSPAQHYHMLVEDFSCDAHVLFYQDWEIFRLAAREEN
jgi:hypothetical protein